MHRPFAFRRVGAAPVREAVRDCVRATDAAAIHRGGMEDRELQDALREFTWAFEMVFHHDWDYAQVMLWPVNEMIGEGGTFLEPRVASEGEDWGYRAILLERYRKLRALMESRGLSPRDRDAPAFYRPPE